MLNMPKTTCLIFILTLTLMSSLAFAEVLTRRQVYEVISQSQKHINTCYKRALSKNPSLQGKLKVSFTIEKSGAVERAEISESAIESDAFKLCVITVFKVMRFPQIDKSSRVVYPLIFQKSSGDQTDQVKDPVKDPVTDPVKDPVKDPI